jgi:hypothetical protein
MAAGPTGQELLQPRIAGGEPVSLLTTVAAIQADRNRALLLADDPPDSSGVFPTLQQGHDILAALHSTCIPRAIWYRRRLLGGTQDPTPTQHGHDCD